MTTVGEAGNDTVTVADGVEVRVFGGEGNDSMVAAGGTLITIFGETGDDTLTATGGDQMSLFAGNGNDCLAATGGTAVVLLGEVGNDTLFATGTAGTILFGGRGDDVLNAANAISPLLFGDDGNDTYAFGASSNPMHVQVKEILTLDVTDNERATRGDDTLDLSAFFSVSVNLGVFGSEQDTLVGDQSIGFNLSLTIFGDFENFFGTAG